MTTTLREESLDAGSGATGPRVGVLALQGDFREHARVLAGLGARVTLVRRPAELAEVDGLVIPGGESSVIDKLARTFGLAEPLIAAIRGGMPVYGTCAGLIMLADTVLDASPGQRSFGGLDIVVRRNAFGSQNQSFETELDVPELGGAPVHAAFIRGPVVESLGPLATPLAALADGRVVAVRQGALLGTSFHPEITGEHRFHEYFLGMVRAR
ncbi:pyridoxal 5'-phosphate synthase glutaminase subunit PdxT [Agromyces sp. NBRC 114283]|uniref:pyridoxal 5'-phosphate synthase glutaminase subunit PdxT n=1 Tax=Agromyces sp. NBRC 114283 TaxID=2994521 RepID=UPI0024A46AE8|nr:pyridoxal 5'-phosphate synthase glutaminase subunit PdxT [Agromyces sp. NBRC 114283]GLU89896.1 pyridoxal 5'-phosphate synthase subunit PdxT [Agromyces sp. NBRC 114283]